MDKYRISIRGKFLDGEWVVDVHVNAIPYFAWGCNGFHTGITGSYDDVISYYMGIIFEQLKRRRANVL